MDYSNAKFLIYNCWEKDQPYRLAGSHLLDGAFTEEEAKEKIEIYKARREEFDAKFPSTYPSRNRFTYITNNPDWWTERKVKVSSPQAQVEHRPLASQ
jgi:hypothetical protein